MRARYWNLCKISDLLIYCQEIHLFFHSRKGLFSPFEGENSFLSTVQSSSKKRMLHKARARNARPYGHSGIMRSSFFRNIVGARIARPLLEFL